MFGIATVLVIVAITMAGDVLADILAGRFLFGGGPSAGGARSAGGPAASSAATASPRAGENRVTIDGQDQGAVERVQCGTMIGGLRIKIFMGDHGVVAILNDANPPAVLGVQFSKTVINGGVTLEYDSRRNEGTGQVTKQGDTYAITGTGISMAPSDAAQQVSKSFEIDVTCP
jgi:ipoprotein LpqH